MWLGMREEVVMIETWNMGKVVPVGITLLLLFSVRNVIRNVDHYHWGNSLNSFADEANYS